jgi:hypothetical protein
MNMIIKARRLEKTKQEGWKRPSKKAGKDQARRLEKIKQEGWKRPSKKAGKTKQEGWKDQARRL